MSTAGTTPDPTHTPDPADTPDDVDQARVRASAGSDQPYEVLSRREHFKGAIFSVLTDDVSMPGGGSALRDWTHHAGAAAVVALDDAGRVVLIRQYRHPLRTFVWETPAGLMDVTGESGVEAAKRELAEEADFTAARWDLLVDVHTSPGYSDQLVRVFLARDLTPVHQHDRFRRQEEEADLTVHLVDLDEAVAMVLRGELTNGASAAGVLAAARARDQDWALLRPADTPWPAPARQRPARGEPVRVERSGS